MTRRKRSGATPPQPWGRFMPAQSTPESLARIKAAGLPAPMQDGERLVMNNRYTVVIAMLEAPGVPGERVVHLSIKRNDRKPMRDWRDLQRIKNELVGYECEAVELFPADSRMVDTANQYHLWCIPIAGVRFPFGFDYRAVDDDQGLLARLGAVQRPFKQEEVTP